MRLRNPLLVLVLLTIISLIVLFVEWHNYVNASSSFEKFQYRRMLDIAEGFAMSMIIITVLVALTYREEVRKASRGGV